MQLHTEILSRRWSEAEIMAHNLLLSKQHPNDFHELAVLMQRSLPLHADYASQLRFAFEQKERYGYHTFTQRSSNGPRLIQAPPLALKHVQRQIHQWLNEVYQPHPAACGFVDNRGIQQHAHRHAAQARILCLDIKKCFRSTTYLHVMDELPKHLPDISPPALRALIYLCTHDIDPLLATVPVQIIQKAQGLGAPIVSHIQQYTQEAWLEILIEFAYDATDSGRLYFFLSQSDKDALLNYAQKLQTHTTLSFRKFFYIRLLLLIEQRLRQLKGLEVRPPPQTARHAIQLCEGILQMTAPTQQFERGFRLKNQKHLPFVLPQGAPSSPILSNICLHTLDEHFTQMAENHKLRYSRYADDLCFSGRQIPRRFTARVAQALEGAAFRINRSKVHHQGLGTQQRITGLVVNPEPLVDAVRLDRTYIRKLRSALNQLDAGRTAYGPLRKNGAEGLLSGAQILGHLSFVRSISPQQYHRLVGASSWAQAHLRYSEEA